MMKDKMVQVMPMGVCPVLSTGMMQNWGNGAEVLCSLRFYSYVVTNKHIFQRTRTEHMGVRLLG